MVSAFYICLCLFVCFDLSFQIPVATNTSEEEIDYDITFFSPPNKNVVQHARIGDVLHSIPDESATPTTNLKKRWELIQNMKAGFAKRWTREYLASLQPRIKWKIATPNIEVGQVVLLMDANQPPGTWALGRITEVHPGSERLNRVVTVQRGSSLVKRPINKIALLPQYQD